MKTVSLIHTVKSVSNTFEEQLKDNISQKIKVYNLLDEFLAKNPNEIGEFTVTNINRLFYDIKNQELTGADIIVTTCSTLTPHVEKIRPFISVPIIAIDDAMTQKAVSFSKKIFVLATAESTILATCEKLLHEARAINKNIELDSAVYPKAFQAMQGLDMKTHDDILIKESKKISGYDCIVLAQASMAHLEEQIQEICGIPVLSSPKLCIEQINETLNKIL